MTPAEPAAVGVPRKLAAFPLRTFRAADASVAYAHPYPRLRRLEMAGSLHRVAHGYYIVVPAERVGTGWLPALEAAAAGIAGARFWPQRTLLMGVSAARAHGAIPGALSTALVAAPAQHDPIMLLDRAATVRFVKRDTAHLQVASISTELGPVLVTSMEQTVLDLARKPPHGVAEGQIPEALGAMLSRCDRRALEALATRQRLVSALQRAQAWAR
jgi:predicted transcriptional regulator of viral defense system